MGGELEELALRVEALQGPDREVDAEIHARIYLAEFGDLSADIANCIRLVRNIPDAEEIERYTASLDAAMTLATGLDKRIGGAPGLLNEAWARLSKQFALHTNFWPADQDYCQWLARYFTAAALRSRARLASQEE